MPLPNRHGAQPQNNGTNQYMRAPQRPQQPQNYPPQRPMNAPQQYNNPAPQAPMQQAPQQDMSFDFNDDNGFNFDNSDDMNSYSQPQQMAAEDDYTNRRQQELQPDDRNPFAAPMRPTPNNAGMPPVPNRQQLPDYMNNSQSQSNNIASFNAPQEDDENDISFNDAMNNNAGKPAANFNNPDEIEDDASTPVQKKSTNPFAAFGKKNNNNSKHADNSSKAKSFNLFAANTNNNANDEDEDEEDNGIIVNNNASNNSGSINVNGGGSSDYGAISVAFGTSVLSLFGFILALILGVMLNNWGLIRIVALAFLIGLPVIGLIFGVLAFVDKKSSKIAAIVGIIASVLALGIGGFAYVEAPTIQKQLSQQITEKVMSSMGGLFGGSSSSSSDSSTTDSSTTSSSDSDSDTDSSSNSDDGSYCKVTVNGVTTDCNDGSTVVNNDGSSYDDSNSSSGDSSSSSSDTTASN